MKARIKKLGFERTASLWAVVGAEYNVAKLHYHDVRKDEVIAFDIIHPNSSSGYYYCLVNHCAFIGGDESKWELIGCNTGNTNDAYDRAMGVL